MQKRMIEVSCYVAGAGAFGVFLRWLQDQLAFNDAGLPDRNALHVMLPVYLLACALVFRHFVKGYGKKGLALPESFAEAFANNGRLYAVLRWAAGALLAVGGIALLMSAETDKFAGMLRAVSITAILAGVAFPLLMTEANREPVRLNFCCGLAFLPMLLYAVWLVYCYRANSINPIVMAYAMEVFTVIMAMVAFFRVAGFPFQTPKPERCLFDVMFAAVLCFSSLADERRTGMQLILFATGLVLLYTNWVMVANLRPAEEKKETAVSGSAGGGFEQL